MPYNHSIRQAKQILHNNNAVNRPVHTAPQSSHAGQAQNQQQTATYKTVSYALLDKVGLQPAPRQKQLRPPKQTHFNTPQTRTLKTQCTKQAQTLATQHTTVGTQTDDTIAVSNDTITATVHYIIDQILGRQEGSRLDITIDSRDGGGGAG